MEALYKRLMDLNGTYQNKVLRTLPDDELAALREYASTQEPLPFSNMNNIEISVRKEQRRRA